MRRWIYFFSITLLLLFREAAFGQATGTIDGSVYDPSGALVPAAVVTATNQGTNQSRQVVTDDTGKFTFTFLPVGSYTVVVAKDGFSKSTTKDIVLQVNTTVQINAQLEVTRSAEAVNVTGEAPLVQATSTTLVQVVDQRRVQDLPLNGRNVLQLMSLNAGVSTQGAGGGTSQIQNLGTAVTASINGSRGNGTNFLLDGGDNNDSYVNVAMPFPNPDAVQEFSIQTSTFDAQYGRGIGGVVNVVTRSGTNQFHGSAFNYLRNYKLNAADFFTGRDSIKRNQFGGSIGGPVILPGYNGRNKTFFFGAYQGTKLSTATPAVLRNTPSEAMKRGDFSEWLLPNGTGRIYDPLNPTVPFPGNIIPDNRIDPVARRMLAFMPASAPGSQYQLRIPTPTRRSTDNQVTARLDHLVNSAHRISGRVFTFYKDDPWVYAPEHLYFVEAGQQGYTRNITFNHAWVIAPTWVNDFNFTTNVTESNSFPPAELAARSLEGFGARVKVLPDQPTMAININGWSALGLGQGYTQVQKNHQWSNTTNYVNGRHNVRFGGEWRRYSLDKTAPFNSGGNHTFNGQLFSERGRTNAGNAFAEFMMGQSSAWRQQSSWSELLTNNYVALFVQEDWRASSKLTFNFGLRWDPRFDFDEELGGKQMTFIPGAQSQRFRNAPRGLAYLGDPEVRENVIQSEWGNLAPRVGIAYQITPKTVVRSAYGVFYDLASGILNNRVGSGEPFVRLVTANGPISLSNPYGNAEPLDPRPLNPDSNFVFTPYSTWALPSKDMPTPYMQNWNVIMERQVVSDLLLRVGYVGSKGTRLLQTAEINAAVYGPGATAANINQRRPYQPIAGLQLATSDGWSKYHALQVTVQKRWSHGFSVLGNYTWSKSIDPLSASNGNGHSTGPDPYNYSRNIGVSDFDMTHKLVASGIWAAPSLKSSHWLLRSVVGGWQNNFIFTANTGLPFTVLSGVDNMFNGLGGQFADLTGADWQLPDDRTKGEKIARWFNTGAFRQNAVGTIGTGGRNQLRDPGAWNVDYSAFKSFRLHEELNLQLRGEFFNVFNHANLGGPVASVNNPNFGRINSSSSPRIIQLALRLAF